MLGKDVISEKHDETDKPIRRIKSFVRRQGRLTKGQAQSIETLWPKFGIEYHAKSFQDMSSYFGRTALIILEIGFGMGHSLVAMAKQNPDKNYLGIEVHQPGVGACLMAMQTEKVSNIRVICHDAVDVLEKGIPDASLTGIQLFFPDPWHKARHHKRRIVQRAFVELIAKKLMPGGWFHIATDWENYAEHMVSVLSEVPCFVNLATEGNYISRPDSRPLTKFEQRGHRLGHSVWDLMYRRT